jgi:aminoglycoside phosphotransferase (APT) family kinase protein
LAFLPDLNVLVQGPVREDQTLLEMIASAPRTGVSEAQDELHGFVRKAAAGLAGLHHSGVRFGVVWNWEDELVNVRDVVEGIATAVPSIANAAEPLLAWLTARAVEQPPDPIVTAHGTFHPGQVLIYQNQLGFIDFDSFCQAEPALDLALFFRRTKAIVLSAFAHDECIFDEATLARLFHQADAICEMFLVEYERHAPVSRQRIALWEALDFFTVVLHSWTKVKPDRLKYAIFLLEQHLRSMKL